MPGLWERRAFAAKRLEAAEVKLIKLARTHREKTRAQIAKLERKGQPVPEELRSPTNPLPKEEDVTNGHVGPNSLNLADQLVPRSQRPMLRVKPKWAPFDLGFLGIGTKIDTIDWARKEIEEVEPQLERSRAQLRDDALSPGSEGDTYPPRSSAFIKFNQQLGAHCAMQSLTHHMPSVLLPFVDIWQLMLSRYSMHRRYIEQSPDNVNWIHLSLNPYEQNIRQAISYGLTGGLIIAWSFPGELYDILCRIPLTFTPSFLHRYPLKRYVSHRDFPLASMDPGYFVRQKATTRSVSFWAAFSLGTPAQVPL